MNEKIVLIDGHSILNRAFYGLPDLTNAEGLHTNAIYGFLTIMFKILEEEKPNQREQIKICASTLEEYFPDDFTPKQKVELIERLVKEWHEKQIKDNGRNR